MSCGCKNKQVEQAQQAQAPVQEKTNSNTANQVQEAIKSTLSKYYNVTKK
jgi:hypothetical protein